jgi:hypothetical protein
VTLPLGFHVKSAAVADFSCKGQPTNLAGPLDHPSEPNIHPCKADKNAATAISGLIWLGGLKFRKQTDIIFQFYFLQFIHRSHIYRDIGIFNWLAGVNVWPTGVVQWPCQVDWLALTTKIRNCRGFYVFMFLRLKNKTQRQSHISLDYFLMQYHFALQKSLRM